MLIAFSSSASQLSLSSTLFCCYLHSTAAEKDTATSRLTSLRVLAKHLDVFMVRNPPQVTPSTPGPSLCTETACLQQNPATNTLQKDPWVPQESPCAALACAPCSLIKTFPLKYIFLQIFLYTGGLWHFPGNQRASIFSKLEIEVELIERTE